MEVSHFLFVCSLWHLGCFPFNGQTGQTRISLCINGNSRKSGENGSTSKLIQIFGLNWPEVQMCCVPFNNVTVLTGLAVLMESALGRLLARRASRRPGTPLERKMDAFGRPNSGEKGNYFQ